MPIFYRPVQTVNVQGTTLELWVSRRKMPFFMHADAILVPVAPDLKMVFGVAKLIRDFGANAVQYEANRAAPLPPGQAFIGAGGRYRFKYTVLAVIFDEVKRTTPDYILQAVRSAMQQAHRKGAKSLIFPDMTENLLTQPTWITPEQRHQTAEITARIMLDAIMASRGIVPMVKIWCWEPANADIFVKELKRLATEGWDENAALTKATEVPAPAASKAPNWLEYGPTGKIKHITMPLVFGELQRIEADAFLRPTSVTLELEEKEIAPNDIETPGTRLVKRAGPALEKEMQAVGAIPLGGATLTGAGALENVRHILHLGCRAHGAPATAEALWNSVQAALVLAEANHLKTLILPNIGGGKNDYPVEAAVPLALEAILNYVRHLAQQSKRSGIETIYLFADNPREEEAWNEAVTKFIPSPYAALLESFPEDEH